MQRVAKEKVVYALSAANEPALRVAENETFCLELQDCYAGRVRSEQDDFPREMGPFANPATGPVYVEGARPGDVLGVSIQAISICDAAVMVVGPKPWAAGAYPDGRKTAVYPVKDGAVLLREGHSVPVRPMVGVIGTAPQGEPVPTTTPGPHGGNLDCKEIVAGVTVYFPVNVDGALLAAGDLHALMGDGEVCGCGAEVSGELVLQCRVLPDFLPTPCVESEGWVHLLASARSLDACEQLALEKAHQYLTGIAGLDPSEAVRLMSLVGELHVCQVVDPLKTVRFSIPKWLAAR
ncbi:MAG: acetamidase/formamidase family protein [Kiritimatiellae bacterium]|nr:acetamidase/formamidase family protein [Kiritimatiellia bacterium]